MAHYKDISGQRFGHLVAIEYKYTKTCFAYWLCRCDCGNRLIVNGSNLRRGKSKSCGCARGEGKRHDLTGRRFGMLVAEKYSHKGIHGELYWLCLCDCGERKTIRANHLVRKRTKSCGCLKKRK